MLPGMGRERSRKQRPLTHAALPARVPVPGRLPLPARVPLPGRPLPGLMSVFVLLPMLLVACERRETLRQAAPTPTMEVTSSVEPSPSYADDVPEEFRAACGRPGSEVSTERLRVVIRRADCDLTGVTISSQGRSVEVPEPGGGVGNSSGVYVEVDEAGVMTFTAEAEVAQL